MPLGTSVLAEVDDAAAITGLQRALAINEDPGTFGHCMCYGSMGIECYGPDSRLAILGVHHGLSIRWSAWRDDAELLHPPELAAWFRSNHLPVPREPGGPEWGATD